MIFFPTYLSGSDGWSIAGKEVVVYFIEYLWIRIGQCLEIEKCYLEDAKLLAFVYF